MNRVVLATIIITAFLVGCSSDPIKSKQKTNATKKFNYYSQDYSLHNPDGIVGGCFE
ncbi:hypothetical protein [Shewanella youngdeokensis]|uniref:Lipoprotein n=1 Tax=Shewanella youngdeokensis TaxID=2999068 RepID=A0ABZ0JZR6_9GAMM|nr:hypothetical protein RGE70_02920 [Shewanella sp. DAU334]